MAKWKTDEVEAALRKLLPGRTITRIRPGGDVDSTGLAIAYEGDALWLRAFTVTYQNGDPDNLDDVTAVELRNQMSDGDGGIQTVDPEMGADAARVRGLLRGLGFDVARTLDDFF